VGVWSRVKRVGKKEREERREEGEREREEGIGIGVVYKGFLLSHTLAPSPS
jgi:hypothetical protein